MAIHLWCPRFSDSAVAICESLRAHGLRAYKSRNKINGYALRKFLSRVKAGDLWINWGSTTPQILPSNVTKLNITPRLNKKQQLLALTAHGVQTLEVSNVPQEGWIGRSYNHQGGIDLINSYGKDYWTRKLNFSRELRIHVYQGKTIHSGLKVPRTAIPHPWIKSYLAGWKIDYSRAKDIAQDRRTLAKKAIAALNLDFGAVDIGITSTGPVVIEVNTAPGLQRGPSVEVYTTQFLRTLLGVN